MPELPEIETVKRQLTPHLVGQPLLGVVARRAGLRQAFPDLQRLAVGQRVREVARRSKYLLITFETGTLLVHLGMSGHLRWLTKDEPPGKHDHLDLVFKKGRVRLNDARRFGVVLWQAGGAHHQALANLGPEPLLPGFDGKTLRKALAGRTTPIKVAIMDPSVVVGVGNIYATEALFRAKIDPRRRAYDLTLAQCNRLVKEIKAVLEEGIAQGGSTLRDFHGVGGEVGTFSKTVAVYGRAGQPCRKCYSLLSSVKLGGRASVWCSHCQK